MAIWLEQASADFEQRFAAFLTTKREVSEDVNAAVRAIIDDVRARGDAALAEFIDEGHFTAHIKRMRVIYQERRDILRHAMESRLGDAVSVSGGHAGLQLLYRFNAAADDAQIAAQALAEGVVCRPLSMYYVDKRNASPGLNLGFAAVPEKVIVSAAGTLARVIERHS